MACNQYLVYHGRLIKESVLVSVLFSKLYHIEFLSSHTKWGAFDRHDCVQPKESCHFWWQYIQHIHIHIVVFRQLQLSPLTLTCQSHPLCRPLHTWTLVYPRNQLQVTVQPLNLCTTTDVSLKATGYYNNANQWRALPPQHTPKV